MIEADKVGLLMRPASTTSAPARPSRAYSIRRRGLRTSAIVTASSADSGRCSSGSISRACADSSVSGIPITGPPRSVLSADTADAPRSSGAVAQPAAANSIAIDRHRRAFHDATRNIDTPSIGRRARDATRSLRPVSGSRDEPCCLRIRAHDVRDVDAGQQGVPQR